MIRWPSRKVVLLVGVTTVVLWLSVSAGVVWNLTHRSTMAQFEPAPIPAIRGLEERVLTTTDGERIGSWLVAGRSDRGCVIVLHGNGASRSSMQDVVRMVADRGETVLALSLRCHGDSTGDFNDFGLSASQDVIAAVAFLENEFPGRRVRILGRSLGAAAAIFAARELGHRVSGYFLEYHRV
jgi:uncharacterized protein